MMNYSMDIIKTQGRSYRKGGGGAFAPPTFKEIKSPNSNLLLSTPVCIIKLTNSAHFSGLFLLL